MTVVQNLANQRLQGSQTFTFLNTQQQWASANITIDRTVNQGLNSLTPADTLQILFDYSPDGGANWFQFAFIICEGGPHTAKGVDLAEDSMTISEAKPGFPSGTGFRIRTVASTPVRIAGTVTYF